MKLSAALAILAHCGCLTLAAPGSAPPPKPLDCTKMHATLNQEVTCKRSGASFETIYQSAFVSGFESVLHDSTPQQPSAGCARPITDIPGADFQYRKVSMTTPEQLQVHWDGWVDVSDSTQSSGWPVKRLYRLCYVSDIEGTEIDFSACCCGDETCDQDG